MSDLPGDPTQQRYAERMFPPPVDHGIAQPDRAVASVKTGTDTVHDDRQGKWYEGGGQIGERAVESIVVYPPTRGLATQSDPFEPVKIGILVDMDIGQLLSDWVDATILAVEDALNEGVYDRPVEIRTVDARGLPRENYTKVLAGYRKLVADGCVVVLGPMISDNSVALRDLVNSTGVACIGWTGAVRFNGEYCFTVANGDIPTESVMGANWCFSSGYRKVGFFWEKGSSGTDYADYFRNAAQQVGVEIIKEVALDAEPARLPGEPRHDARAGRRGDRLHGLRLLDVQLRQGVQGARLGPAALHGHGVHVLLELQRVGRGP